MNWDVIGAIVLGLVACGISFWATTAYLRDLRIKAEADRIRKDRAAFLAFMAHEQRKAERAADEATFAVAEAFRAAMGTDPRVARIRAQIAANEAARFERDVLAEIELLTGGGAS